ncbi:MAG: double-strand break repair protein AddB, partial [Paracoccaceae bacterium]
MLARSRAYPPEYLARIEVFVNTRRMQRRISRLFDDGPARLLPKIRLVTDLAHDPAGRDLPPSFSPLRRRLELSQLIARLLDKEPDLAPRSAIFDLADSLALLLGEMQDEGVSPDAIRALDVTDHSGHWQRSKMFLDIVERYFGDPSTEPPDIAARQRRVTEHMIREWANNPPTHPVIVAGSTGSRGSTALLMPAVAGLPQGAIVLPGFDFDLPQTVWAKLNDALTAEDHPQFRLARIIETLGFPPQDVRQWHTDAKPPSPARNRLVSLALRPAPATDQWMQEGPALKGIDDATRHMSLIEAPSERAEAVAIALVLREAAELGKTAALVTPDRLLTRQVTAALDRWRIVPDVSAGDPLDQTAPGRLLRHVAELFGRTLRSEALLVLLKHPLVNSGPERGQHLLFTRELELKFRRDGPPYPGRSDILEWANKDNTDGNRLIWAKWVIETVLGHHDIGERTLSQHHEHLIALARALVAGPGSDDAGRLWEGASGREAHKVVTELSREAVHGGSLGASDFVNLFHAVLKSSEVRDPVRSHPDIMIWGTLESRVQGADLVILGGLNDGTWPELPSPDPWLNREMRLNAGLLVPERRVGLAAHDFQQAVAAKEVILSRSVRSADAETVPSRWLNRFTNLMGGISDDSRLALEQMRSRGRAWLDLANLLEAPDHAEPEPRPSPRPPVAARPRSLSVTAISRLIRDPYAIYAQYLLGLKKIDPLRQKPDALLRGTVLHSVLEEFIRATNISLGLDAARGKLLAIADTVLAANAPWPAARILWRAKLERVADIFLNDEVGRQSRARP